MKLTGSHGTTTTLALAFLASLFLTAALSAQAPAQRAWRPWGTGN